ncbi:hypothetical protein BPOR_1332g00010 [Botrytis porri]|uniref:Uncharacterized protein n=1 Tax=Botrytis porri TaxID=87229 RepID=A0A4Z1K4S8_9HELO|nr:hypothetical protein BPOR_1332g00010 [Botrytis porri]
MNQSIRRRGTADAPVLNLNGEMVSKGNGDPNVSDTRMELRSVMQCNAIRIHPPQREILIPIPDV